MTTMIDTINGITSGSHQRAGEFIKRAKRDDDGSHSDVHVLVISSGKQSIMQFYLIFYSIFFLPVFGRGIALEKKKRKKEGEKNKFCIF